MTHPTKPNEERSAEEELAETSLRDPSVAARDAADPPSQETTVADGEQVLEEFGEDVASSPAQRARPKPGPPARSQEPGGPR